MIKQFQVGGFDKNFSYLIIDDKDGKECLYVDPCGDTSIVLGEIQKEGLKLNGILVSHSHFDHVEGIPEVTGSFNVPVFVHENGVAKINQDAKFEKLNEGDSIKVGRIEVNVLHTPGHIDDAICYQIDQGVNDDAPALITGDTLFVEGCGRTNRTNAKDLFESLQRLKNLDTETKVYAGHDYGSVPVSTIEHERSHNRFFLAKDYETFLDERFPSN